MAIVVALLTTIVALSGMTSPASAQSRPADAVLEALDQVLGLRWNARGHVIQHREATLVLRGEDRRIYTINTAGLDVSAMTHLKEGHPVIVALDRGTEPDAMPIAASVAAGSGPTKTFRRVEALVEAVDGQRITVKTREGVTLTLDGSRIVGEAPRVAPHEITTLVYEQEPALAGVWIDTCEIQPSATPRTGR